MNLLQRLISILALLALAACGGGGGNAGTPPFGGGSGPGPGTGNPTPAAADLVLTLSASSIANSGNETVVATAIAIDGSRNTVAGVPVTVSVDSDGVVTPGGTVTAANGQLTATVGIGSNRTPRTITITARSGQITKTTSLQVQDGGGGSGTPPSDLLLTLSNATIANSGSGTVTATVVALDARRNVLPGVVVSIEADQGATVAPAGTATNNLGQVTAAVGIGANRTNRTITITATAAGLPPRTATLQVVDAPTVGPPVAAALSLTLSSSSIANGAGGTILATATAVDANRNALPGIPVAIRLSDNSAVASVSGATTNGQGQVTASIGIGADRSNRNITVTAVSGTLTQSATFSVTGARLTASLSPQVTTGSTNNQIEYRLRDSNGLAMAGVPISVSAVGLPSATGNTDFNGNYLYTYTAPAPGTLDIAANSAGTTAVTSVVVQAAGGSLPAVPRDTVIQSASLTPTPTVVSVNAPGSTANQVELRALFLGPNNRGVENVRVRFSVDPANASDGVATQVGGATYAFSDATGVARGTFIPGQRSSPTNGVTVEACWSKSDFPVNAPCPDPAFENDGTPKNGKVRATLTIADEALSVNIRTNELIKSGAAQLTYIKEFVVMVVDAAGQAKSGVRITPSVDLPAYYKGFYFWNGRFWQQQLTLAATEDWTWDSANRYWRRPQLANTAQPQCRNEDVNRNGVREAPTATPTAPALVLAGSELRAVGREEDLTWNGDIDPRKADVAVKMVGSPRTDENGLAIVQIEYGRNLASWVDFVITVTAAGVSGTESRATYSGTLYGLGNLPFPGEAIRNETVSPAFVVSPYGRGTVCTDSQ